MNNDYNNSNNNNNNNNPQIDDTPIEKLLSDLFPNYSFEKIINKLIKYNFDIDSVILSILDETNENDENNNGNSVPSKLKFLLNSDYNNIDNNNDIIKDNKKLGVGGVKNKVLDKNKLDKYIKENEKKKRIDLHGYTLSESIYIINKKLQLLEEQKINDELPNISLTIITGKGLHSYKHKAILRPNLAKYLRDLRKQNKYKLKVDDISDEGAIYVTLY